MRIDEPERAPTERVAPTISLRLLGAHEPEHVVEAPSVAVFDQPTSGATFEVPWSTVTIDHPGAVAVLGAVVLGLGASAVWGDARAGILLVAALVSTLLVRSADRLVPFSFGEGFVGYRADLGWPQGIQEEDDVRWSPRPARQVSGR